MNVLHNFIRTFPLVFIALVTILLVLTPFLAPVFWFSVHTTISGAYQSMYMVVFGAINILISVYRYLAPIVLLGSAAYICGISLRRVNK